jgi:molybdopterin biosynthesis enzyme MoaB
VGTEDLVLDNSWEGDDEGVISLRQGLKFDVLRTFPKNDNDVEIANMLARLEDEHKADAVFIDGGYGTGVSRSGARSSAIG